MQKHLARIFSLALGMVLMLGILAACGSGTTGSGGNGGGTSSGPVTIKVATDLPVTGSDGTLGKSTENGAHLAVDQANQNKTIPNVTLQFDPQDDVGASGVHDPAKGAQNVTSLVGDYLVAGIVGPFNSNVAKAELGITNQAPIAQISPSNTNDCLTSDSATVGCNGSSDLLPTLRPSGKVTYFRVCTTDSRQGPADADFLYKKGYKRVYVVDDTEVYGVGLAKYFIPEWQKLGGTIIDHKSIASTNSYVGLLTTIAATHPDVIYFAGNFSTGGTLMRQQMLQVQGLSNTAFAGGDGINDSTFAKAVGGSGGPVYSSIASVDVTTTTAGQKFISDYKSAYGSDVGPYSGSAYDAMNILIQGIKTALSKTSAPKNSSDKAGGTAFRQAVINAIQGITYNGVLGTTSFDANGDTTNRVFTIQQVDPSGVWKTISVQNVQ